MLNSTVNFAILENIKAQPYELALVVPVLLGLKSASTITLTNDDEKSAEVERKLQTLGLKTRIVKFGENPRVDCLDVALEQEIIEKLSKLDLFDNYEHGLIYGYPQSAVEAFMKKDILDDEKTDLLQKDFPINFRYSNNNWEKEHEVLKEWNDAVKTHTPKLYRDFLELDFL